MLNLKQVGILISAVVICLMTFSDLRAQQPPKQPPKASNAPDDDYGSSDTSGPVLNHPQQQDAPIETLHVNVQVVNLFFNVKDKKGGLIPNLKKEDFEIREDGKPQTIKYFAAEANQPLTLGLLIDTSGSQTNVLPMEKEVGAQFLRDVLTPKDLAFLINFDISVDLIQDYTSDTLALRRAMDKTKINTGGGSGAAGIPGIGQGPVPVSRPKGTLLYDAIYLAADEKLKQETGRKAIIILTDGVDQGSQETLTEAYEAASKADTIIYVLLIADSPFGGFAFGDGEGPMKKLAEESGGRVIRVGNDEKKLKKAFDDIAAELRTQYMIGYTSTNKATDGKYRKVELKTNNKDLRVQARKGYYAPKE